MARAIRPVGQFYHPAVASIIDQAVCIRQWDWSETSQTVSLLCREQGLVRGIAKGSKREKSKFSGGFEVLTRGELQSIMKPTADLATFTAWDLQETFPAVRRSLQSYYSGMYLADLVRHALTERNPHPALFDSLVEALRLLAHPMATAARSWAFSGRPSPKPGTARTLAGCRHRQPPGAGSDLRLRPAAGRVHG